MISLLGLAERLKQREAMLNRQGDQMVIPSDADPHFFVDAGQKYGLHGFYSFRQDGAWDLQRVGPGKKINTVFIDFSTVAIGLHGAVAGIPLNVLLTMQDVYAAGHSNFGTAERDGTYTHLREDNV